MITIAIISLSISNISLIYFGFKLINRIIIFQKAENLDEIKSFENKKEQSEATPEEIISIDQALREGLIEVV